MFFGLVRLSEAERDYDVIEASRAETAKQFGIIDEQLEARDYLVADTLTMGDIPFLGFVYRWFEMEI